MGTQITFNKYGLRSYRVCIARSQGFHHGYKRLCYTSPEHASQVWRATVTASLQFQSLLFKKAEVEADIEAIKRATDKLIAEITRPADVKVLQSTALLLPSFVA